MMCTHPQREILCTVACTPLKEPRAQVQVGEACCQIVVSLEAIIIIRSTFPQAVIGVGCSLYVFVCAYVFVCVCVACKCMCVYTRVLCVIV